MNELYAWCTEPLIEHSICTLNVYSQCFERNNIKILSRRLGLNSDLLPFLKVSARMAIALHDIGKAHRIYQNFMKVKGNCQYEGRNRLNCSYCNNRPSYPNHEFLSAYIYWQIYNELRFISKFQKILIDPTNLFLTLGKIFTLTIIQHHHAMRGISEISNVKKPYRYSEETIRKSTLNLLERLLEASLKPVFPEIYVQIFNRSKDKLSQSRWPSWYRLRKELKGTLLPRETLDIRLKLYSILSGPLCICDNLSAHIHRPGPPPRSFLREALRVYPCLAKFKKIKHKNTCLI